MHKHQFIHIEQVNKIPKPEYPIGSTTSVQPITPWRDIFGVRAGCIECGEIRTIWPDGTVIVEVKGKEDGAHNP